MCQHTDTIANWKQASNPKDSLTLACKHLLKRGRGLSFDRYLSMRLLASAH
jgi:hypothetical protein